jgi:hypothetical protein
MLFRGVTESDFAAWPNALARATEDVETWERVIGVDVEKAVDERLFRVLEWGGMEVVASRKGR